MMKREPYDVLISVALPVESHISAMLSERNIPWIACLSDPWPESLLPAPYSDFSIPGLTAMQYRVVEKVFNSADALVFPCPEEYDFLTSSYPALDRKKSFIIPHVAPSMLMEKKEKNFDDRVNVIHAGSLSRERVCAGLAEAIGKLPESSRLHFKFIGGVHANMMDAFKKYGAMYRIQVIEWKSKREVLETLASAQAGLLVEAEMQCYPFLPSKLADYSATGRPVIAITGNGSAVARLIGEHDAGVVADHNLGSISSAFQRIENNHMKMSSMALWEGFCAETVTSRYFSLIESLRAI